MKDFILTYDHGSQDVTYHIRFANNLLIGTLKVSNTGLSITWEPLFGNQSGNCNPKDLYEATCAIKERIGQLYPTSN